MNKLIKRKESIVWNSTDIINELGFQGLSIKEICKREGISEGALYKHFKSKNEIILGVLDYCFKYDLMIAETIEVNKLSAKESIIFYIKALSEYYESNPAITSIEGLYEVLQYEQGISYKVREIFETRIQIIKKYVDKGLENKEFQRHIDGESLAYIILGTFEKIILKWRTDKFKFSLKQKVELALDMILNVY